MTWSLKNIQSAFYKRIKYDEFLVALLIGIVVIVVGVSLGWENNKVVPLSSSASAHYTLEPHNRLSFMSNWDGPIYLSIAKSGYTNKDETNFFPLYPIAIHTLDSIVHSELYSGLIVSWMAFIGAIYFYIRILKRLYDIKDNIEAMRGVWFFVLFPTGVFLLATYTEALFAFLSLAAIYYALQKKYIPTALFTMLATATHFNGIFDLLLIGIILLEEKAHLGKIIATLIVGALGIVSYMLFLQSKFHNYLAYIDAQKNHSWLNFSPHHLLSELITRNGIFVLLLIISVIYWWNRRKSFSIYSFLFICIMFISDKDLSGIGRYSLMAFPMQFMFYEYFRDKKLGYQVAFGLTAIAWAYFLLQYTGGYTGG